MELVVAVSMGQALLRGTPRSPNPSWNQAKQCAPARLPVQNRGNIYAYSLAKPVKQS